MWIAAALVTTISFGTNNTIFKWSTGEGLSKVHLQFIFYFVAFILTFGYGMTQRRLNMNLLTFLLGSLIGILNAIGNIQMSKAFERGPASLTSPLIGMNVILPILTAGIIFHEHIALLQWLGIMIMIGSAMIIQFKPANQGNTNYLPWMVSVIISFFSFGILGILMKTSSYMHIGSLNVLIAMYGGGSIYLAICCLLDHEKWRRPEANVGSIVGFISVLGYGSYFYALKTGMASIVFPIVSLNCLIVVLAGCWFFKEKLKLYQIIGVFSALLGIIFTKI